MTISDHGINEPETCQRIDDFLLGNLDDAQVASFEAQMQDDFELAMAVSDRIAFLDLVEQSAHIASQPVHLKFPQATEVETRDSHFKAACWLLGLAAAFCVVINLTAVQRDDRSTTASSNAARSEQLILAENAKDNAVPTDELGQVANVWLAMLEEEPVEEADYEKADYMDQLDLLPISTDDDSWIGELAVQAYQDSEA